MRRRWRGLLVAWSLAALARGAAAQTYPIATEPPRTTDAGALRALAIQREVHERFARGLDAEGRSAWADAATEFERIIALNPAEPMGSTARYDLALAEAHQGHDERAVALLQAALRLDPGFAAAAANLTGIALERGDLAVARSAADRFVAIAPASARARYARGLIALRSGDLATARADFRILLDANPAYAIAHYDLALVEIDEANFSAAESELETALSLAPSYARARFALGTLLLRDGRRAAARSAFDRCARDAEDPNLRDLAVSLRDRLAGN
ncbi:MAG: tetratricopeptide repeat protein [Vulcanimicrobiaceae bacterium]